MYSKNDDEYILKELISECVPKKKGSAMIRGVTKPYRTNLQAEKGRAIKAARELMYDKDIRKRIEEAKSVLEIDRALQEGRHRMMRK